MTVAVEKPQRVYYFGTCLADMLYPEAGMDGIRLIEREGVEVVYPPGQTCCGQPAYNAGFFSEARAVARRQLAVFHKDYPIVVPSGSCAGMLKHHYPKLFAGTPESAAAARCAGRVFELSEFMVRVLDARLVDRGKPIKVTWHSSCHALREMKTTADAKALIGQLHNVELIELVKEQECCGFGGTFAVKHPQLSAAMVRDKVADIQTSGARRLITGDCGCLMNITGAMAAGQIRVRGQHLAEFLWERTHA